MTEQPQPTTSETNEAAFLPETWEIRQRIATFGRMLYDRQLTDAAGGNVSVRAGYGLVCITPRYTGQKHQWRLDSRDVLVVDKEGKKLDGEGDISREARVHLKLLNEFPDGNAMIHCHPRNALVFAMTRRPIPPILESTLKFGIIKVTRFAPAHSPLLAEYVAEQMRGQEAAIRKQAAAVLAPWHGLFVLGKDLDAAFDAAERIDNAAYLILMSRLLPDPPDIDALSADLVAAVQSRP